MLEPGQLGRWVAQRTDIWQMGFLSARRLGRLASDRGLTAFRLGDHVKHLWQLGLLRADLVVSMHRLDTTGLIEVDRDDKGAYYYADERQPAERDEGLGSSFAALEELPPDLDLRFHPFRYYVLYHIDRCLYLGIHPMQMLISVARYPELVEHKVNAFQRRSSGADFRQAVNRWNDTAALSIAAEPHTYEMLFGIIKCSASAGMEPQRQAICQHGAEYCSALKMIGRVRIQEIRQELCISAQRLDPNRTVHTIPRLTDGEFRVKDVKGRLGGRCTFRRWQRC
jgi:hypothetical protein